MDPDLDRRTRGAVAVQGLDGSPAERHARGRPGRFAGEDRTLDADGEADRTGSVGRDTHSDDAVRIRRQDLPGEPDAVLVVADRDEALVEVECPSVVRGRRVV